MSEILDRLKRRPTLLDRMPRPAEEITIGYDYKDKTLILQSPEDTIILNKAEAEIVRDACNRFLGYKASVCDGCSYDYDKTCNSKSLGELCPYNSRYNIGEDNE